METKGKINSLVKAFIALTILISSCIETEPVSVIPEISYISFDVVDAYDTLLEQPVKVGQLEFNFMDGDADFGVYYEVHTNPELPDSFKYGLFVDYFDKIDGTYIKRYFTQWNVDSNRFDTLQLHQWIQYNQKLDRVGQNKTVKGIIRSDIQIASAENLKDTFRLEFYIRDRALNKSNVEHTIDYLITK